MQNKMKASKYNWAEKKYEITESFRSWIRKLIALLFVPIEEVQDGLNLLIENKPELIACNKMIKYLKSTWLTLLSN